MKLYRVVRGNSDFLIGNTVEAASPRKAIIEDLRAFHASKLQLPTVPAPVAAVYELVPVPASEWE